MIEITIGDKDLRKLLRRTPAEALSAVENASHDILNTWQADARNEAPIDRGVLRKEIRQKLEVGPKLNAEMTMTSNTYRDGFNYSYYQHEVRGDKYLDRAAENNLKSFDQALNSEIRKALRKAGW